MASDDRLTTIGQCSRARAQMSAADRFNPLTACVWVRRVIVTPSRLLFMNRELLMGNRVLRQFGEDYALRVLFRDDDRDVFSNFNWKSVAKQADRDTAQAHRMALFGRRILNVMKQDGECGIAIADRLYKFLAW